MRRAAPVLLLTLLAGALLSGCSSSPVALTVTAYTTAENVRFDDDGEAVFVRCDGGGVVHQVNATWSGRGLPSDQGSWRVKWPDGALASAAAVDMLGRTDGRRAATVFACGLEGERIVEVHVLDAYDHAIARGPVPPGIATGGEQANGTSSSSPATGGASASSASPQPSASASSSSSGAAARWQ